MSKSILLKDFRGFIKENQPKNCKSKYNLISQTVRKFLNLTDFPKVFHIIEMNSCDLKKMRCAGPYTLSIIEECLNKYGLSLNQKLTDIQLEELNATLDEKENKITRKMLN